ncbi:hypothetical protein K466DRAFT_515722 [Polyporus arcularius HHB13444]|uniref:Alpha-ketoglutarate-dependent dioxygenase AlkB-like domain-containing protein n=1 Tax=Polyporus arcularius HHB13444 TaxID=1314778 RepID=A0A5C3PS77_9APHY|nr:hypothetical protein K466DRAFT_515722 [Polyporus arcularius HHB13444]
MSRTLLASSALWTQCLRMPSGPSRGVLRQLATSSSQLPEDFRFYPTFFTLQEQCILLRAALKKLDSMESGKSRRRRREYLRSNPPKATAGSVQDLFLPDEYYDFQEGHFDGVIKRYREMHVTSWPEDVPEVLPLLDRLQELHPSEDTQTHILHLASDGEILPHVDNVEASGKWILGVSLGDERTLRLESASSGKCHEIPLPSGSVYIQKDAVRYEYRHSILGKPDAASHGRQRLSIMIRDRIASQQP